MLKKITVWMLVFILGIGVCGCSQKPAIDPKFDTDEYLPEYDLPEKYVMRGDCYRVDDTMIFKGTSSKSLYLYYYDTQSGTGGKLCGKPECTHDDPTSCNAAIGTSKIQIYNHKIYFFDLNGTDGSLMRMSLDGNGREKVMNLPTDERISSGYSLSWIIHRDSVYCGFSVMSMQQAKMSSSFVWYRHTLDGSGDWVKKTPTIIRYPTD